ncbi:bifunctional (p)ppGpp synthase/hydrolase SpoT [uncultured Gammaproteobacteria bacterium]
MIRQYELVERVKAYDPSADEGILNRAYVYTVKTHGAQLRASGDPYFSHPVEVAGILTEMKLDCASIVTGLLHDTVEDTVATLADIERLFGPEVARLVDGVTKLSRIELQSDQTKQAENFRKLVLAMSEDIRVLLVKLADRLHNMRTLHYLKNQDKRRRIARETIEIYAPLAARIGMEKIKNELEDLAFAELHPDARESILAQLKRLRSEGGDQVKKIVHELRDTVHKQGLANATVSGREKTLYSVWEKLQRKNVTFEQLSDIMAFRIVVDSVEHCYQALGAIHAAYPMIPGRFKDYISTAKPNGYRSLHTGVLGPDKQRIEVQIRTPDMHEVAEMGVAAHWGYKQDQARAEVGHYRWLRELLDILEHAQRPEEFLEHTKLELFREHVFCFTPKGDLIELPSGSTPVDFAYAVHSQVGDTCTGAKVNGRMVPLRHELHNGDQVEIVTSKTQTPAPDWERFVVTGKAKARIRKYLRTQQRAQYVALGRAMLQKTFKVEGCEFTEKVFDGVLKNFQATTVEDLYANVGSALHSAREVFHAAFPAHKAQPIETDERVQQLAAARQQHPPQKHKGRGKAQPLPIRGLIPGMAVHYARCCHPLPGDRIVGIVTTGKGVTIHTVDCETLDSFSEMPERWIDVSWDAETSKPEDHVARISLTVANEPGSLGALSTVIGKNGGNITNLKITSRHQDYFEMLIDVDVKDSRHLTNVIAALRATPVVNSVVRPRGR